MTGGSGLAARATGRGRRCWAERAEGESWAVALGPVRERVGRAGRGKEGGGRLGCWRWTGTSAGKRRGAGWAGFRGWAGFGFPISLVFLSFLFQTHSN